MLKSTYVWPFNTPAERNCCPFTEDWCQVKISENSFGHKYICLKRGKNFITAWHKSISSEWAIFIDIKNFARKESWATKSRNYWWYWKMNPGSKSFLNWLKFIFDLKMSRDSKYIQASSHNKILLLFLITEFSRLHLPISLFSVSSLFIHSFYYGFIILTMYLQNGMLSMRLSVCLVIQKIRDIANCG